SPYRSPHCGPGGPAWTAPHGPISLPRWPASGGPHLRRPRFSPRWISFVVRLIARASPARHETETAADCVRPPNDENVGRDASRIPPLMSCSNTMTEKELRSSARPTTLLASAFLAVEDRICHLGSRERIEPFDARHRGRQTVCRSRG